MQWSYYKPKFEYEKTFFDLDWPWAGHKYFAYDLVRNIKPNVIVELGTHWGTSFFSMCQAVKDADLSSKLFAIDTWKGDKQAGYYNNSVFLGVKKIKQTYYNSQNIDLLKMTFDDAVSKFKKNSIDLLHIDGLHTYDAVKHDYENWFKKVKKDGIIMFHDIAEKKDDFGVYKLWDELKNNYQTLEFHHSHGLGVLFRNKNSYSNMLSDRNAWQQYYSCIYENTLLKLTSKKNHDISNKHDAIKKELKNLKKENMNLKKAISRIKSAKTFLVWQKYCKFRDIAIKRFHIKTL